MSRSLSERAVVFLIGAVQFVNILDFVMVMPLGPDFARALGIPESHLGYVGGSYAAAAAVSGLAGAFFLDRFDRRRALAVCMAGLVLGTAAGGFAWDFPSLLAARIVAGLFGGPATSLAWSIIADTVPPERRGRAVGAVMTAFSIASVLGVPIGLELARQGSWRLPFFATAGLGLLVVVSALRWLPPMRAHLDARGPGYRDVGFLDLLRRPIVRVSYCLTAVVMCAGFLIIPNISAYVQGNLGFPRAMLGLLYLIGGVVSFVTLRITGRLVDRFGSFRVGSVAAVLFAATLCLAFVRFDLLGTLGVGVVPSVIGVFVVFMLALGARNVAYNTLVSKVPGPLERARFMSLQSAVQHVSTAFGAFFSSVLLTAGPGASLLGVDRVAVLSIGLTLGAALLMYWLEGMVASRSCAASRSSSS